MSALQGLNQCKDVKTFSKVLAEGVRQSESSDRAVPMIVSRRYGKGMVVLVNGEGLWQWDFFPSGDRSGELYKDLWTQIIHWMATYSEYLPGQEYSLGLSAANVSVGESVRVRVGYRGQGAAEGDPVVVVHEGHRLVRQVAASMSASRDGGWDAVLRIDSPGFYRIGIADESGSSAQAVYKNLHVRSPPSEMDELSADPAFLERLAQDSGGRVISREELRALLNESAAAEDVPEASRSVWVPTWDKLWLLAAIIAFLSFEWYLGRRNGLI